VVFDERELKNLIEIWGADHIMLGTDYPFDMAEPDPVGFLGRVKGVSDKDMALVAAAMPSGCSVCRKARNPGPSNLSCGGALSIPNHSGADMITRRQHGRR